MVQRFSGNGWPAYADTSHFTRFTAAGQGWWAANPDVAVVFTEFIERFAGEVEPIAGPVLDDWSYANRLVRGSATVVSCHGSATAIDLNALQHPRGARNTFSVTKRHTMIRIKNSITDDHGVTVLRLGMDFTTVEDDMHVEISATPSRVKQAADKIRKRNALKAEENVMAGITPEQIAAAVWAHPRKLTAADAAALGGEAREGDDTSMNVLLRFSPAVARLRREQAAQIGALTSMMTAIVNGKAGGGLTQAQAIAAATAGANAALAQLGHDLIGDND